MQIDDEQMQCRLRVKENHGKRTLISYNDNVDSAVEQFLGE